jgi:hypothetical protein
MRIGCLVAIREERIANRFGQRTVETFRFVTGKDAKNTY